MLRQLSYRCSIQGGQLSGGEERSRRYADKEEQTRPDSGRQGCRIESPNLLLSILSLSFILLPGVVLLVNYKCYVITDRDITITVYCNIDCD